VILLLKVIPEWEEATYAYDDMRLGIVSMNQ
jgi:hypothetical protein